MIIKFLLRRKIFYMMYYEVELWLMLHFTVKFRQNMSICHKLICKAKFHIQTEW